MAPPLGARSKRPRLPPFRTEHPREEKARTVLLQRQGVNTWSTASTVSSLSNKPRRKPLSSSSSSRAHGPLVPLSPARAGAIILHGSAGSPAGRRAGKRAGRRRRGYAVQGATMADAFPRDPQPTATIKQSAAPQQRRFRLRRTCDNGPTHASTEIVCPGSLLKPSLNAQQSPATTSHETALYVLEEEEEEKTHKLMHRVTSHRYPSE